jgi:phosphomannomutase
MNTDPTVFKAYDIRGISPDIINPAFAERLSQAVGHVLKPKHVMVGRDMRSTSPELEEMLTKSFTDQGINVTKIGLCSTPMFTVNLGLANGKYDLGIMITASHNPAEYNGFKLTAGDASPIGQGTGMEEIRDFFITDEEVASSDTKGTVEEDPDALKKYLDKIFSLVDLSALPEMKIAIDTGNGMGGFVLPELIKRIPQIKVLPLYWEPDGTFPNHEANPIKLDTLKDLNALVKKEGCALGVAYDGDCDRIGFVDENAEFIQPGFIGALIARQQLEAHPGSRILYDLRGTWSVQEEVEKAGGSFGITRVGHAFIKKLMREQDVVFAGELSMHYYYKDLYYLESGDMAFLSLLKLIEECSCSVSELWKPLKRYHHSGEINSEVKDRDETLRLIEEKYKEGSSSISKIDGVWMQFGVSKDGKRGGDAWWFNARPSNTEPLIRLNVEAKSKKLMEEKRDELLAFIRST